jgi:hypothetical protein
MDTSNTPDTVVAMRFIDPPDFVLDKNETAFPSGKAVLNVSVKATIQALAITMP